MIINIIILLGVVITIAVLVNIVGSSKNTSESVEIPVTDKHTQDTKEPLEDSFGTLSDRAIAALQYQRMKNSFEENCKRDPQAAAMITNEVKYNFDKMARQLATIGTDVSPEDVQTTIDKDGLPPGWKLEK